MEELFLGVGGDIAEEVTLLVLGGGGRWKDEKHWTSRKVVVRSRVDGTGCWSVGPLCAGYCKWYKSESNSDHQGENSRFNEAISKNQMTTTAIVVHKTITVLLSRRISSLSRTLIGAEFVTSVNMLWSSLWLSLAISKTRFCQHTKSGSDHPGQIRISQAHEIQSASRLCWELLPSHIPEYSDGWPTHSLPIGKPMWEVDL